MVELAAHQGNGLELAGPIGRVTCWSFLATMELGSIRTDLGEVFFSKAKLVTGGWRCVQLN